MNLISITGPESTGKSSLAEALARHFHSSWVKEFSREYLLKLGRPYDFADIAEIARGQLRNEAMMVKEDVPFLFCDTDLLVCKIWSRFKYGNVDPWLERVVTEHRYDLYLLCDIDLPWADDPLREHPDRRKELFDLYYYELKEMGVDFEVISGLGEERTRRAISAIEKRFPKPKTPNG